MGDMTGTWWGCFLSQFPRFPDGALSGLTGLTVDTPTRGQAMYKHKPLART